MPVGVMPDTWVCSGCGEEKDLEQFAPASPEGGNRYGRESRCRACKALASKVRRDSMPLEERRRRARDRNLKHAYGISLDDYEAMYVAQDGKCAICDEHPEHVHYGRKLPLCVDHDHATGSVRALLCGPCNALIGMAQESVDLLAAATQYLEAHR